jgi:hypothetical protein
MPPRPQIAPLNAEIFLVQAPHFYEIYGQKI